MTIVVKATHKLFVAGLLLVAASTVSASTAAAQVTAIRAGRLVDPEAGTIATDQIILVEGGTFQAIGAAHAHKAAFVACRIVGEELVQAINAHKKRRESRDDDRSEGHA